MKKIRIISGDMIMEAELNGSLTSIAIEKILPLSSKANRWGDEIYFQIPFSGDYEDPREVVEVGDLAYWPPGKAFCIFWGPTPASVGNEVRPASAVNVVGRITSGIEKLKRDPVDDGDPVTIEIVPE